MWDIFLHLVVLNVFLFTLFQLLLRPWLSWDHCWILFQRSGCLELQLCCHDSDVTRHKQSLQPLESLPQKGCDSPKRQPRAALGSTTMLWVHQLQTGHMRALRGIPWRVFLKTEVSVLCWVRRAHVWVFLWIADWLNAKEQEITHCRRESAQFVVRLPCCIRDSSVRPYRQAPALWCVPWMAAQLWGTSPEKAEPEWMWAKPQSQDWVCVINSSTTICFTLSVKSIHSTFVTLSWLSGPKSKLSEAQLCTDWRKQEYPWAP